MWLIGHPFTCIILFVVLWTEWLTMYVYTYIHINCNSKFLFKAPTSVCTHACTRSVHPCCPRIIELYITKTCFCVVIFVDHADRCLCVGFVIVMERVWLCVLCGGWHISSMNERVIIYHSFQISRIHPLIGMYAGQPNMGNVLMLLALTVVSELTLYQLYSVFLGNPFLIIM